MNHQIKNLMAPITALLLAFIPGCGRNHSSDAENDSTAIFELSDGIETAWANGIGEATHLLKIAAFNGYLHQYEGTRFYDQFGRYQFTSRILGEKKFQFVRE